ncbi:unnamed protein product, partial [Choristocarpus tenellus]
MLAAPTSEKLHELVDKLRERLTTAEAQLETVRSENQQLRVEKMNTSGWCPTNQSEQALAASLAAQRERPGRDQDEIERLHRELREAQAKAQLILSRFENLEARTLAQADLHEGSVDRLQETNRQLRDLRRELQDIQHERDVAEAKGARADELEETVLELRKHSRAIEEEA